MKKLICLLCFLLFCFQVSAQTGDELQAQLKRSSTELNQLCEKLKSKLGPADKTAFLKAQQDWLKFRASNGQFKSMAGSQNIIVSHVMNMNCQLEMTEARIKEIKEAIHDF